MDDKNLNNTDWKLMDFSKVTLKLEVVQRIRDYFIKQEEVKNIVLKREDRE